MLRYDPDELEYLRKIKHIGNGSSVEEVTKDLVGLVTIGVVHGPFCVGAIIENPIKQFDKQYPFETGESVSICYTSREPDKNWEHAWNHWNGNETFLERDANPTERYYIQHYERKKGGILTRIDLLTKEELPFALSEMTKLLNRRLNQVQKILLLDDTIDVRKISK